MSFIRCDIKKDCIKLIFGVLIVKLLKMFPNNKTKILIVKY